MSLNSSFRVLNCSPEGFFFLQVIGRMLSATTAMIHWDEPEEPNGQVVGYRVYYTSDNTLPVNQVCGSVLFESITLKSDTLLAVIKMRTHLLH